MLHQASPPAPDLRANAAEGLGQKSCGGQATAAGSSTMSRVREGSTLTPGFMLVVSVTVCR